VMTESLVAALRRREPDVEIHILAPPWTAPLGERMAGVVATHEIDSVHGRLDLPMRIRTGNALKPETFDLAIVLPTSLKSAITPFVAGIRRRRGYVGEMRFGLLNETRRIDAVKHRRTIDRFVALADDGAGVAPTVTPPILRHDEIAGRAVAMRLGLDKESRPVVALCPGAEFGPSKQWPAAHFAALAGLLAARGFATWIFGSDKDRSTADQIVQLAGAHHEDAAPIDLCGATDLLDALDLMSRTTAVVSNDSGLMHVAAAIGRPLVALFGSTSPEITPPLGKAIRILERELPCRPCFKRDCPLGHLDCLNLITAAEVAGALTEVIDPKSTPTAA
jgi:lipopolysaccharide heptosyltransferase II